MSDETMEQCGECGLYLTKPSTIHAEKQCACGRTAYRLPTETGLRTEEGESVRMPVAGIRMSLDRSQATGTFSQHGLRWFIDGMIAEPNPKDADALRAAIEKLRDKGEAYARQSELLKSLDLNDESEVGEAAVNEFMEKHASTPEFAALALWGACEAWLNDTYEGDREELVWHIQTFRMLLMFRGQFNELIWRGYSTVGVDQIRAAVTAWEARTGEEGEEFWQQLLEAHPFLINLVTTGPVVVEGQKAYVGGKSIKNRGGHLVDFLIKNSVGGNLGLLEIKTPGTPLLAKSAYRTGVHAVSSDLSGAVVQVLGYRDSLLKDFHALSGASDFQAFNPQCIVLAGSYSELDTDDKRWSFEIFRGGFAGVVLITYDELFARAKSLLDTLLTADGT